MARKDKKMDAASREDFVFMGLLALMDDADMKLATLGLMLARQRMPKGRSFGALLQANEALPLSSELKTQIHTLDYPPVDPTDFFKEVRVAMAREEVTFTQLFESLLTPQTEEEKAAASLPLGPFLEFVGADGTSQLYNMDQIIAVFPDEGDRVGIKIDETNGAYDIKIKMAFSSVAAEIAKRVGVCKPDDPPEKCRRAQFITTVRQGADSSVRLVNKKAIRSLYQREDGEGCLIRYSMATNDPDLVSRTPYAQVRAMLLG
jgi:hypothetical protein